MKYKFFTNFSFPLMTLLNSITILLIYVIIYYIMFIARVPTYGFQHHIVIITVMIISFKKPNICWYLYNILILIYIQ